MGSERLIITFNRGGIVEVGVFVTEDVAERVADKVYYTIARHSMFLQLLIYDELL